MWSVSKTGPLVIHINSFNKRHEYIKNRKREGPALSYAPNDGVLIYLGSPWLASQLQSRRGGMAARISLQLPGLIPQAQQVVRRGHAQRPQAHATAAVTTRCVPGMSWPPLECVSGPDRVPPALPFTLHAIFRGNAAAEAGKEPYHTEDGRHEEREMV